MPGIIISLRMWMRPAPHGQLIASLCGGHLQLSSATSEMLKLIVLLVCSWAWFGHAAYPPPPNPPVTRFHLPYLALKGHKFFVPNPNAPKGAGANDNFIVRNYKKFNAVTRYFHYLLLGNPALTQRHSMVFDPKDGLRWRPEYIRKFGYRGQRLVDFLGSGPTKEQLQWSLGTVY